MSGWFRRLLLFAMIGAATAVLVLRSRRTTSSAGATHVAPESTWPPMVPPAAASVPDPAPGWVAPVGSACPEGFPIKANSASLIFHVPGGRFYDRTIPQRCYATADAAERDGYRRAKA